MHSQHVPMIMEIIDNIVSPDERRRKYSDRQILKVLVLLQLFRVSYRSAKIFLTNHGEYIKMIGIKDIPPSFQTLSGRARLFDLHSINREVTSIYTLRWEIERTFSILEEIMKTENIWYTKNRDYDTAAGLKTIAYNLMVISNNEAGEKPGEIMKIVSC